LCQKSLLTSVEDNTNALFVEMKLGYRVEDHQQKVFIEKNSDQKNFSKKNRCEIVITLCNFVQFNHRKAMRMSIF